MAKTEKKPAAAAPAAVAGKTRNRVRRNAIQRKCLPKEFKRLFAGSDRTIFRMLLKAWQSSRHAPSSSRRAD